MFVYAIFSFKDIHLYSIQRHIFKYFWKLIIMCVQILRNIIFVVNWKFSSLKFHNFIDGLHQLESSIHVNGYIWHLQVMTNLYLTSCSHWSMVVLEMVTTLLELSGRYNTYVCWSNVTWHNACYIPLATELVHWLSLLYQQNTVNHTCATRLVRKTHKIYKNLIDRWFSKAYNHKNAKHLTSSKFKYVPWKFVCILVLGNFYRPVSQNNESVKLKITSMLCNESC